VIAALLHLYFSTFVPLGNRLACFDVLFGLYPKSAIGDIYNNPVEDLVEIQKNLNYLHLLSQTHKVIKPMELREFISLDKALVVRNLVTSGGKDFVLIAARMMVDYGLTDDWDLVSRIEERLKIRFREAVPGFKERVGEKGLRLAYPSSTETLKSDSRDASESTSENVIKN
jgi:hypothetical protein